MPEFIATYDCENCAKEMSPLPKFNLHEPAGHTSHYFCSSPCIHEWLCEHYGEMPLPTQETNLA